MKLKMLYDTTQMPSTALLASFVEPYGYASDGPIVDDNNNIIGNIWFDVNDPNRTNFTELYILLSRQYEFASYEAIE